ncbi:hypothetical protein C9374_009853 [Naegleria lovaniensis]|uniref:EF-hand domain-containing protein n=1 Tax=Naegleria lovaniensis TaxID=51637 RepID=A0AA88KE26_NAELO|nr:uncharacterized protein C9374_009853 [Naegleria lovaniensis]KAG2375230.1 hypothetical protein C9374_009853 [Naegleria lovaniensis]
MSEPGSSETSAYYETTTSGTYESNDIYAKGSIHQALVDELRYQKRVPMQNVILKKQSSSSSSIQTPVKGILMNGYNSPSSSQYTTNSNPSSRKSSPKSVSIAPSAKSDVTNDAGNNLFIEEMKKAFSTIDTNGDGKLSKNELAVAIRSFGMDPSAKELNDLFQMAGSKDGFIDFEQFSSLMKKSVNIELFEDDRKKKKSITTIFDSIDKNGDGFIDLQEFKELLESIPGASRINPEKDVQIMKEILASMDQNKDGLVDLNEFYECMLKEKDFFEKCKSLFEPHPLQYINVFKNLPSSFRTSTLYSLKHTGKFNTSNFVTPNLNESGINYLDLTLDTCSKNILPIYASNFKITLNLAKGVPLPRENVKIIDRKVYMILASNDKYISNIHQVSAIWSPNKCDEWSFTNNTESNVLLRTMVDHVNTSLLLEFVIVVEGERGATHEICCGHTSVPLNGDYQNPKNYDFFLMGGSIKKPVDIAQEDVIFSKNNVVGKLGVLFKGLPKPQISLRIMAVTSIQKQQKLSTCPPNIVTNYCGWEILSTYRKVLAKKLFPTRVLDERMVESTSAELRWFPQLLDDKDLWLLFLDKWQALLNVAKKSKDKKPQESVFLKLVHDVKSALFCTNLPKYTGRQTVISLFFESPKEVLNSNGLMFKPFDASECVLSPMYSKTIFEQFCLQK